ncbi:MAG: DNA polymerase IV [Proteobacteria bacterium]|nr:DNA polymerase IV [Pseudomonadota bacterium]MDA1286730.1 DNA polymerase IV [Pseudomonadota bacterium]
MPALCRDCLTEIAPAPRCPNCRSPRVLVHAELFSLTIAHMDCDAFYASVEKRDNPELRNQAVIVGGAHRSVVSTCCYIARIKGVRSAMPMFQALKLCPEAVVVKPRMSVYVEVSRQIREMMKEMTPAIEPLSLDEAFLDLTGTERLHHAPAALQLARLVKRMEVELGISGSIGLSHNKFLAKIASDIDKPRGFSVIGKDETDAFLRGKPVGLIWGVGKAFQTTLERDGIRTFTDLLRWDRKDLGARYGTMGDRLWHLARGMDYRRVSSNAPMKSISNETTFYEDTAALSVLDGHIWRMSEKVADRAKKQGVTGRVVTLKVKQSDHKSLTRRTSLPDPTQIADRIYSIARILLEGVIDKGPFRLIGVGISNLEDLKTSENFGDLLDPEARKREKAERVSDKIREKFGDAAILKGRALR